MLPPGAELPTSLTLDSVKKAQSIAKLVVDQQFELSLLMYCALYIFKQAFAIPGSVLLNIIGGAFFPLYLGLLSRSMLKF